jgi:hypothetical protein
MVRDKLMKYNWTFITSSFVYILVAAIVYASLVYGLYCLGKDAVIAWHRIFG